MWLKHILSIHGATGFRYDVLPNVFMWVILVSQNSVCKGHEMFYLCIELMLSTGVIRTLCNVRVWCHIHSIYRACLDLRACLQT